jgi:FtsP/CotA-like multicopper oxidase with cupredoxin domain
VHLPANMDGSPFDPVPPGGRYDYIFTIPRGTAGTYWYHPHPDGRSEYQAAMGLFGAFIVRAADDPIATLPEKVIVLSDNRFRADGSIEFADSNSTQSNVDMENGREGNVLFVNGQIRPSIPIHNGEVQRWRVINASAARVYRLAIPGQALLHVGSDDGLFEHAVETQEIVVANSERVELLVRGTGKPGSTAELTDLPYDRYMPQTRPADWNAPHVLLDLRYSDQAVSTPVTLPTTLRVVPALDTATATVRRTVVLSQGMINGHTMDMSRVDMEASVGATEIWDVENVVGMDHPFHLHGFQFQVLDRNGVPEPFRSWKDVVNIPKHEAVRFIVHYADFPGKWMFHCHILAHEDHGMMAVLEVR